MPTEELAEMFRNVVAGFEEKHIKKEEFLNIIIELMDRQVMTYEVLEGKIRAKLVQCKLNNCYIRVGIFSESA